MQPTNIHFQPNPDQDAVLLLVNKLFLQIFQFKLALPKNYVHLYRIPLKSVYSSTQLSSWCNLCPI